MEARGLRRRLWVAGITSGVVLVVTAFEWSFVDVLTPFLFPVLQIGVWLLFLGSTVWAALAFTYGDRRRLQEAVPLLVSVVVGIVVLTAPFTDLWLKVNWHWYKADRERIVRQVQEGKLSAAGG